MSSSEFERAIAPVTDDELAAMPAKTKKHPHVVELYQRHNYLTAYGMHTDLRVREDPRGAVGSLDDWERHGQLQLEQIRRMGVGPLDRVLEIGCGTGRLARKLVPYLSPAHYTGVDLSPAAIDHCKLLAVAEEWDVYAPRFLRCLPDCSVRWLPGDRFEFAWAFSVFIHLPTEVMIRMLAEVRDRLVPGGRFVFSYVADAREERTGLKQFRHTIDTYQSAVQAAGLRWSEVYGWNAEQKLAAAVRS